MRTLRRVAVLGAGTMGSRIAAHFANAGIPAVLLDIVIPNQPDRNFAAKKGIENAANGKPAGFFTHHDTAMVRPGNLEDNLDWISDCDWVIEAVTENLDIKRDLWRRVDSLRKPGAILSTNTSGIPLNKIAEGFSSDFRRHFLGTHFFNPPRYLHLLEVIPGQETDAGVLQFVSEFADRRLGKGVVPCKNTPNFIANRIGSFFGSTVQKVMQEDDYSIEEVDVLTGSLIGLPNSASFRLLDLVGLDVWAFVGENLYNAVPDDPWRERFRMPPFHAEMMKRGWLGDKSGQGFYKKIGKGEKREIQAIDWKTLEYHPARKISAPTLEAAKQIEDLPQRLQFLVSQKDRYGTFLWKVFSDAFIYSAERVPEIAGRIVEIDRAMKWGYAHKLGPFELWDALGFDNVCARLESEGRALPENILRVREAGAKSLYRHADAGGKPRTEYLDFAQTKFTAIEERPGILVLSDLKRARNVVKCNAGASLMDLGDGVFCVEFHSKMNSLGEDNFSMMQAGAEYAAENGQALVIGNQGSDFSVGANLMMVLLAAQEEEWDELNFAINRFQQVNMAMKYAPIPVVVAPFGRTLGGGTEISLHAARCQASAETYMGLVEVGVGLIPGGGGCKELLLRLKDPRRVFELVGMGKVSTSAEDAKKLGLLNRTDRISMNPERLIGDAKDLALSVAKDYVPGTPRSDIRVGGENAYAMLKLGAWTMRQSGHISDYDVIVAEKLATILSGGRLTGEQTVSEQYLLDLEREAFLSLCGNAKTQERMQYMLKTGKPLRN
jgi:3-hydroxyacyl-CoA dehydrogenase